MGVQATPTDILAALFALADNGRFASDPDLLHGALYQARRACPELAGFGFSAPPRPRSALATIALDLLKAYGTIEDGPDGSLEMSEAARRRVMRDVLPRFPEDARVRLKRAAAVLDSACGLAATDNPRKKGQ